MFPRKLRTPDTIGRPELVTFFDSSTLAYCCVVYIRWRSTLGGWHTQLVASKVRVTSQVGMPVPRSELGGLVIVVRFLDSVIKALEIRPKRFSIVGDSTCTISSCETNCSSLAPYFQNRVSEIIKKMSSWGIEAGIDMRRCLMRLMMMRQC